MHDEETRRKAFEWYDKSPKVRLPRFKAQLCRDLSISVPTFDAWIKERKNGKGKVGKVIDQLADLTDDEIALFNRQVYDRAMKDNASAKHMELFARLRGMLVEKSIEVKISANADELARLDAEAERRTRDFREQDRAPSLQERPRLLPEKIRKDT